MKTLGDQARDFREAKKWNTKQMAAAVETSRQNIESLEAHGNRIPKYIGDLAHLMGTTVDAMLHIAEMRKTPPLPAWPFAADLYARFTALSDKDKGYIEGRLSSAIEQCESAAATNVDARQSGPASPDKSLTLNPAPSEYAASTSPSVEQRRLQRVTLPKPPKGPSTITRKGQQRERSTNRKRGEK